MKRKIITAFLLLAALGASAQGQQGYTRSGKTFIAVSNGKSRITISTPTAYTYKDTDGKSYPIYVGKTGSCYILRVSKNGNEYRKYLGKEISAQICKEMGIEYKPKTKGE